MDKPEDHNTNPNYLKRASANSDSITTLKNKFSQPLPIVQMISNYDIIETHNNRLAQTESELNKTLKNKTSQHLPTFDNHSGKELIETINNAPSFYWTSEENEILTSYVAMYQLENPSKFSINWQPLVDSGTLNRSQRQCAGHHQALTRKDATISKVNKVILKRPDCQPSAGVIGDDGWSGKEITNLVKLSTQHTRQFNGEITINWVIIGTVLNKPWNVCKMKYDQLVENKSPVLSVPDMQILQNEERQNKKARFEDQIFKVTNSKTLNRPWTPEEIAILQEMGPKYTYETSDGKRRVKWREFVKTGLLNRTGTECASKFNFLRYSEEDLIDAEAELRGINEPCQFV